MLKLFVRDVRAPELLVRNVREEWR